MAAVRLSFIIGIIEKLFGGVVKKKSTENYQGLPYITTLLSTSLWIFYGILNPDGLLIMTVNGAGAVLQLIYVTLFLIYAPRDKKVKTAKLIAALNVGFVGLIIALTLLAIREEIKLTFVGILCAALTIGMYASPLSVMGMVIKMKSVEYMPFLLSFFLFLNGGVWSIYAALVNDFFLVVPNAIGFIFGSAQIIIYAIYKNKSKKSTEKIDEEKGSVTLVRGAVEIKAKSGDDDEKDNSKNVSLHKGRSLPQPIVKGLHNVPTKLMKTLSLGSHEMDSVWDFGVDLESGEKNHP